MKHSNLCLIMILSFCCPFIGNAAGPITHVYFAEKWMQMVGSIDEEDKETFISGNVFPDIQYLGEIARKDTHESGVTIEDVYASESAFQAGTRLHSFLDEKRESLVNEWQIYSHIEEFGSGYKATLLKLVEDEILYDRVCAKEIILTDSEIATGLSLKTLQRWHYFLTLYFSNRPSQLLQELADNDLPFLNVPSSLIKKWSQTLPTLAQKKELIEYVNQLEEFIALEFYFSL